MWYTVTFEDNICRLRVISTENLRDALSVFESQNRNRHPDANTDEMREMRNALTGLRNLLGQFNQAAALSDYSTKCRIYSEVAGYDEHYMLMYRVLFDADYHSLSPEQLLKIQEYILLLVDLIANPPRG